jgi:hypothetical protein
MSNVNLSLFEFQIKTRIKKMEIPSHIKKCANLLPVKSAGSYEVEYQKCIIVNRLLFNLQACRLTNRNFCR